MVPLGEGAGGRQQMVMSSPSISRPELGTDSERHCTGRGRNSRPEYSSCLKGWTISSLERLRNIQQVNNIRLVERPNSTHNQVNVERGVH